MTVTSDVAEQPAQAAEQERREAAARARDHNHLTVAACYAGALAAAAVLGRRRGVTVPSVSAWDTARMAAATYKGSRLLAKDKVTAPLRAPFTRPVEPGAGSEVNDEPTGEGARRTVGELLSCPFCLGQWIATGLAVGLVFAPRMTRLVASTLTAAAGADFLHYAYTAAQQLPAAVASTEGE